MLDRACLRAKLTEPWGGVVPGLSSNPLADFPSDQYFGDRIFTPVEAIVGRGLGAIRLWLRIDESTA
jgi:hypothetical protein